MKAFLSKPVSEAMTSDVLVVHPHSELSKVRQHFERFRFNGLPVVDDGKLVGWVTQFDLLNTFLTAIDSPELPYDELLARETGSIMSKEPESIEPGQNLAFALKRMIETRHRSFPVTENGRLVGVIAREDIINGIEERLVAP